MILQDLLNSHGESYVRHGNIFVISAPSGAGKSSLVKALCELDSQIKVSISHTTRPPRAGEQHGVNYLFITIQEFEAMLAQKEFLEYAVVYGNYYGTNRNSIKQLLAAGKDIILEIDWQGAKQIKHLLPEAILLYLLPPSLDELAKRLRSRQTDSEETIKKRLDLALDDISHAKEFDFIVVNDNFDVALQELYSIILVHRLKASIVLHDYSLLT
jgi:guanylate kinase